METSFTGDKIHLEEMPQGLIIHQENKSIQVVTTKDAELLIQSLQRLIQFNQGQ